MANAFRAQYPDLPGAHFAVVSRPRQSVEAMRARKSAQVELVVEERDVECRVMDDPFAAARKVDELSGDFEIGRAHV